MARKIEVVGLAMYEDEDGMWPHAITKDGTMYQWTGAQWQLVAPRIPPPSLSDGPDEEAKDEGD